MPVICTGAFICVASGKCPHSLKHEPINDCDDLDTHEWVVCKSMPCKDGESYGIVRCEHIPTAEELSYMILAWWEDVRGTEFPTGDGDWDNVFNEEPDFVREARKLQEEVTTK